MAEVHVTKDRHGHIREWSSGMVGRLWVRPEGVTLEKPGFKNDMDPRDDAMEAVLEYVRQEPGASANAIAEGTKFRRERVTNALRSLEAQNKVINVGSRARGSWTVV